MEEAAPGHEHLRRVQPLHLQLDQHFLQDGEAAAGVLLRRVEDGQEAVHEDLHAAVRALVRGKQLNSLLPFVPPHVHQCQEIGRNGVNALAVLVADDLGQLRLGLQQRPVVHFPRRRAGRVALMAPRHRLQNAPRVGQNAGLVEKGQVWVSPRQFHGLLSPAGGDRRVHPAVEDVPPHVHAVLVELGAAREQQHVNLVRGRGPVEDIFVVVFILLVLIRLVEGCGPGVAAGAMAAGARVLDRRKGLWRRARRGRRPLPRAPTGQWRGACRGQGVTAQPVACQEPPLRRLAPQDEATEAVVELLRHQLQVRPPLVLQEAFSTVVTAAGRHNKVCHGLRSVVREIVVEQALGYPDSPAGQPAGEICVREHEPAPVGVPDAFVEAAGVLGAGEEGRRRAHSPARD
mmetsp:Transcript_37409/g.80789  ORF Transcript_37409/g.80789 Transcript_37409/m.80789 type:complete len:402 (-) Transcript_37409:642-1847(-)